jgi:hypothetical protein
MSDHMKRLADNIEAYYPDRARQTRDGAEVAHDRGNGAQMAAASFLMSLGTIANKDAFELAKGKAEGARTTWRLSLWNLDDPRVKAKAGECNRLLEGQQQLIDALRDDILMRPQKEHGEQRRGEKSEGTK